jgi:hypothetical protein
MSYGSASYGSAAIGGAAASLWFIFFPMSPIVARDPDVLYESRLDYSGTGLFSVFTRQGSEPTSGSAGVTYQIYTSNDPDETPQLQATQEGDGQNVIPAAQFITVTAEINGTIWAGGQFFEVRGRAGD